MKVQVVDRSGKVACQRNGRKANAQRKLVNLHRQCSRGDSSIGAVTGLACVTNILVVV